MNQREGNVAGTLIPALILGAFAIAALAVGLWSLGITIDFMSGVTASTAGGVASGIVIQFGQNFFLHGANKARRVEQKVMFYLGWLITATVDALTNVGEYRRTAGQVTDIQWFVGHIWAIVVIFVEEFFVLAISYTLDLFNDLLETVFGQGIPALEWVSSGVRSYGFQMPRPQVNVQKPQQHKPQQHNQQQKQHKPNPQQAQQRAASLLKTLQEDGDD